MREHTPAIDTVAALSERLAVLLSAGVSPIAAWGYLDTATNTTSSAVVAAASHAARQGKSVAAAIAKVVLSGRGLPPVADRLVRRIGGRPFFARRRGSHHGATEPEAWLALAAAWQVATESGAPLAPSLRDLAEVFRQLGAMERERSLALAGPTATARLVLALPVIGIIFGTLLGFDTLRTLFATVPGWACIVVAGLLLGVAWWWTRALLRRARPRERTPGLLLELMAIGMEGGGSVQRARDVVDAATRRLRLDRAREQGLVSSVLDLAERAGVPAAELLRSEARAVRRVADAEGRRLAAELSVVLMLPVGLCVLPAFLIVGGVPLLITVISSTMAVI